MRKTMLGLVAVAAMSLATMGSAVAAPAVAAANSPDSRAALVLDRSSTDAQPMATCNYRARVAINVHAQPNSASPVRARVAQGAPLIGQSCNNVNGGRYTSCGGGTLWKFISGSGISGWVATGCLIRT